MSTAADPIPTAHPGGLVAAGGDDDGNDPSRRKRLNPTHTVDEDPVFSEDDDEEEEEEEEVGEDVGENEPEAEPLASPAPPAPRRRRGLPRPPVVAGPQQCNICNKFFRSLKALHGHMRSHPFRKWHETFPPSMQPGAEQDVADSLILLSGQGSRKRRFICSGCNREFPTRQALGGHRASHKNQKGCYEKAREAREYGPRSGRRRKKESKDEGPSGGRGGEEGASPIATATFARRAAPHLAATAAAPTSTVARPVVEASAAAAARPAVEGTSTAATTRGMRRRRRLDLNALPVSSDDTNGDNGNGSSTSSAKGDQSKTGPSD